MTSPKTTILLSSYNGARYLMPQLDSLLAQTHPDVAIHVRDDGSSDDTLALLASFAATHPSVTLATGPNLGVAASFFTALAEADPTSDYYAFCDQDDVWHPEKLARAIALLEALPGDRPRMHCARLEYVDAALGHIGYLPVPRELSLANALVQNVAVGCTIVIDRAMRELLLAHPPQRVVMHDWWIYLVAAALGRIAYDPVSSISYRQHAGNLVGGTPNRALQFARRLKRFCTAPRHSFGCSDQARELLACHGPALGLAERRLVEGFVASKQSLPSRLAYVLRMPVHKQTWLDDLILRGLVLLKRY